jgi:hypothetical protein
MFGLSAVSVSGVAGTSRPVFSFDVAAGVWCDNQLSHDTGRLVVLDLQHPLWHTLLQEMQQPRARVQLQSLVEFFFALRGGQLSRQLCDTSAWTTSTSVACRSSTVATPLFTAAVTVGTTVGTNTIVFSFDIAVLSAAALN